MPVREQQAVSLGPALNGAPNFVCVSGEQRKILRIRYGQQVERKTRDESRPTEKKKKRRSAESEASEEGKVEKGSGD